MASGSFITAGTCAHPVTELSNEDLEARVPDLAPGWIDRVLGATSRRVLTAEQHLRDLAEDALRSALRAADVDGEELDLLVCATSFVDDILPATASLAAKEVAPRAIAFDVNAACASAIYGLAAADALLASRADWHRAAVLVAERPTAWADYQQRDSSVFWGDSAGCLTLEGDRRGPAFELVGVELANDNEHPERVRVRRAGTFHHDGRYSAQQVLKLSAEVADRLLSPLGLGGRDLAAFVGHQSNANLLATLGSNLGVPWERQWHNVTWAGNQGSAGVLTAFAAGWEAHHDELVDGDLVLLTAVGGGYSAGGALLRWHA